MENKQKVQVKVGAHNTKTAFDLGAYLRTIRRVFNYPSYTAGSAHGDISLIVLSEEVTFGNTVNSIFY